MTDLAQYADAAEHGAILELKDPAGEPILKDDGSPVTITLAGTDSAKWRKAEDVVGDRRLKTAGPRNGSGTRTVEELRNDAAFMLASVTLSWDGVKVDGSEPECNLANAKKLYMRFGFVREQVDAFLADRRNFLTASSAR